MKNLTYILFVLVIAGSSFVLYPPMTFMAPAAVINRDTVVLTLFDTILMRDTIIKRDTVFKREIIRDKFSLYEVVAWHLKANEGFRPQVYRCIAGYETIGWGHLWYPGDPVKVDKKAADLLFKEDFERKFARTPKEWLRHERYAFTMLSFQCKMDKFDKSSLNKYLTLHMKDGVIEEGLRRSKWEDHLRRAWKRWSRYEKNGKYYTHPQFLKRRTFEVELFIRGEAFAKAARQTVLDDYMVKHKKYKEKYKW